MIYNENGIILNEEYILEDYFNGSYINSIINESFKDPKTKFGKTVKAAIDWLINKVKEFGQWLVNAPNRLQILANKKKIKDTLFSIKSNDNKIISVKLKGEIVKYLGSDGYKDTNKWINTFNDACEELMSNPNITTDEIKSILYNKKSEDNWFVNENLKSLFSFNLNTDEIVDFSLNVSELSKPLKQIHNNLLKFNKRLEKEERIDVETINAINHYFTQAMSSIRNLSYACITVCMNTLKGNTSDSIERGMYIGKDKKYMGKKNGDRNDEQKFLTGKEKDINELSEKDQIKLIKENINYYRKIQNPTPKIVEAALKIKPNICYSDHPHLNKESTKAAYLILNNISKSSSEVIFNLVLYCHEVTDDIRMLAINAEKFDDISTYEVFGNIVRYMPGKQDKPSEKVINCIFDKCCDYYIKSSTDDRSLAGGLTAFYDYICKIGDLQDPNEKYLQKIFNIIQKNTSINFNAMPEYKLIKNMHDYKIFLDKFN